jgi:hypothetical protein
VCGAPSAEDDVPLAALKAKPAAKKKASVKKKPAAKKSTGANKKIKKKDSKNSKKARCMCLPHAASTRSLAAKLTPSSRSTRPAQKASKTASAKKKTPAKKAAPKKSTGSKAVRRAPPFAMLMASFV